MIKIDGDKLIKDGIIVDPLTPLTDRELDDLIKQFDSTIHSTREWSKKQSSWSGVVWDNMDWFAQKEVNWGEDFGTCGVSEKVYAAGGTRLLTLYCNKFNFFSAATDLKINYAALIKWFQRWKAQAIKDGLTPEIGLNFEIREKL